MQFTKGCGAGLDEAVFDASELAALDTTAYERREINLSGFMDLFLKVEVKIWP